MTKVLKLLFICALLMSHNLKAQILLTTAYENDLRLKPDLSSVIIKVLPAHKNIELLDFIPESGRSGYFKVVAEGVTGYIHKNSVNFDESYYLALEVRGGDVNKLYLENKQKIDNQNIQKRHEENLWAKQYYRPKKNDEYPEPQSSFKPFPNVGATENTSKSVSVKQPSPKVIQMKKLPGGTYEIPCKVNGLALKFIFDTGASDVSISLTEALFMLKNGYLTEEDITGTEYYSIANGEIAEGTTIRIRKLEFGGLLLNDVNASIVHQMKAPLLLGQSAINRLGKIQIDPSNSTLTIID